MEQGVALLSDYIEAYRADGTVALRRSRGGGQGGRHRARDLYVHDWCLSQTANPNLSHLFIHFHMHFWTLFENATAAEQGLVCDSDGEVLLFVRRYALRWRS